ncbi:Abi family protein [Mycobacterium avium subsp. hominissuis]|uniref:Abi family protein n=1 Tax=Mycobacterium avium TaxID=1764 RepID=UPI000452A091|nr:Abi family protein [Mycobacterium avium]ETZ55255.1 abi-like family protein [Mycobacterium avium MAV_120709_2344]MCA4736289.1 Abi family protein [Mycobacterium avium subsp. hominissuis]MCA4740939.1 Abi family protein [Mycobacterium avium subsp. hominissuis]MCA4745478.1 Abi family protein [Mycobacterium avium subsp. hominissuis]MCA4765795.1 Abi family protein [Mycobacterium avium subsp. hominissuis]
MPQPVKPWLSINDQVTRLQSRGMLIVDTAFAAKWLSTVGYYRMSGYWYPFREIDTTGRSRRLSTFINGTTFTNIARLYEFDRELKALIANGLERIEVALRSQIGHRLGALGPMSHDDPAQFRPRFDHATWRGIAQRRVDRARGRDECIDHHDTVYGGQLPIWVLTDVLDFSDLSRLFAGLPSAAQRSIGDWFGVSPAPAASQAQRRRWRDSHPLANWLEHLTVVRNICAHHSRLWNRALTPLGTSPRLRHLAGFATLPEQQDQIERVYGTICVITHLLGAVAPDSSWRAQVDHLVSTSFAQIALRNTSEMGYPTA